MAKVESNSRIYKTKYVTKNGGAGGLWLLGFIGTFIYYIQVHSGTFWLVVLAFLKAIIWPAIMVYHLFLFLKV